MDIIKISNEIQTKINEIEAIKKVIKQRGTDKANAISEYRKQMAITMIKLKNGVELELEGEKIVKPSATNTQKISHGICWKYKLKEQETDALYKSAITNLTATVAQLNALQSLYRHLENK